MFICNAGTYGCTAYVSYGCTAYVSLVPMEFKRATYPPKLELPVGAGNQTQTL